MSTNSEYEVRLSQFEGPLDLLLHLVRKAEVDLRDVYMAQITDQYMRYMQQVDEVDLDRACSFLETASLLLLIKSRAVLPAAPPEDTTDDTEDPAAMLLENLRLYEVYKNMSEYLRSKEEDGRRLFSRLPEEMEEVQDESILRGDAQTLFSAFLAVIEKRDRRLKRRTPPVMRIEADLWSIGSQKKSIRRILGRSGSVRFSAFFPDDAPAAEIAVTFSAMLELWNANEVRVQQAYPFAEITVQAVDTLGTSREAG